MKLHELKPSSTARKRVGRGIGSGHGKTSGRGTKGQRSRTGSGVKPTFEGGQNALIHRLPKLPGFTSKHPASQIVFTDQLNRFKAQQTITASTLKQAGLIRDDKQPVKLLKRGELTLGVNLALAASRGAQTVVEAAGGSVKTDKKS